MTQGKILYFCGISEEHKHIYKDLREKGICGGPEANVTLIKGKNICKKSLDLMQIVFIYPVLVKTCQPDPTHSGRRKQLQKIHQLQQRINSMART